MAVKKITIYECDICKKEVKNEKDLTKIQLPYFEDGKYYMSDYDDNKIDCCDACAEKVAKALAKNIGFYNEDEDEAKLVIK